MLYSFVIPTRERHDVLSSAIKAVLAQTKRNFELVIIDNAGSSHTLDVVNSFASPHIRYVRAPDVSRWRIIGSLACLMERGLCALSW